MESLSDLLYPPDEITDLPSFNALSLEVEQWLAGDGDPAMALEAWQATDEVLGVLASQFVGGLPLQKVTPELNELAPLIGSELDWLRELMALLRTALEEADEQAAGELVKQARQAVQRLSAYLNELRPLYSQREQLSPLPFLDELLHVSRLCFAGELPPDRLEQGLRNYEDFHNGLAELARSEVPSPEWERLLPELLGLLEAEAETLLRLRQGLEAQNREQIEQALADLAPFGSRLVEIQQALLHPPEAAPSLKSCFQCGTANPLEARLCQSCHAPFPRLESALSEAPSAESSMPEHLHQLASAVQAVQEGGMDQEEFGQVVSEFAARVDRAEGELRNLQPPGSQTPPDQRAIYEQARQAMEEGLQQTRDGLTLLDSYLDTTSPGALDRGLELVLAGAETMAEVGRLWQGLTGSGP